MGIKYFYFKQRDVLDLGMWKRLFFNRFRFHRFRLHQQKTRKRPLTIFLLLWVCSLPSPTLYHFVGTSSFIAITLPTSLELIVPNYSVFFFLFRY